jgi:hypothetical protein
MMSAPIDFGDLAKLPHDSRQDDIVACVAVTWLIGTFFVAARFYTRIVINNSSLSASEWAMLAASVLPYSLESPGNSS